jgi:DNA mismatch endonuclease (patch repair protein)
MDVLTPDQRHYNMSRIHSKDTKPEIIVRKWLWQNGYRYRLHKKNLPGKPDIVFTKYKAIVFVHGCFWHMHNCKYGSKPKTNRGFWNKKLNDNVKRDIKNVKKLRSIGWRVLIIWECEIIKWEPKLEAKIRNFLHKNNIIFKNKNIYDDVLNDKEIKYVADNNSKYLTNG